MHMLVNYHNAHAFVFGDIVFDVTLEHRGVFASVIDRLSVVSEMIEVEEISDALYRIPFFIRKSERVLIEPYSSEGVVCSYIADPSVERVTGGIHGSVNNHYTLFHMKDNSIGRVRQVCSPRIIKVRNIPVTILPLYNDMTCRYEIMLSAEDGVHQYHKYYIHEMAKNTYLDRDQEYIIYYEMNNGRLNTTLHYRPLTVELSIEEDKLKEFIQGVLEIPEGEVCSE